MNLLTKNKPGAEYIITDMMATRLSRKKFEQLKEINPDTLGEWNWCECPDFSWWSRVTKKLTPSAIRSAYFEYYNGRIIEY